MRDLLINCYYDGLTVADAMAFISRCYLEIPTAEQVLQAKQMIKDCTGKAWQR